MGYYTVNGGLIGTGEISIRKGVFNLESAQYYASPTDGIEFDFTNGSLPSGMYQANSGPVVSWDSTGVKLSGDAPNDGYSYPLRIPSSFNWDYLFQLSTRIDADPTGSNWCSDAGIAIFTSSYLSDWTWKWGSLSGRIAVQNNCRKPHIYGPTSSTSMGAPNSGQVLTSPYVSNQGWVTMHMYHEPSLSRTRYEVTLGSKDWNATGTRIGSSPNSGILEISSFFYGDYYVGISADDDADGMYANGFRYIQL